MRLVGVLEGNPEYCDEVRSACPLQTNRVNDEGDHSWYSEDILHVEIWKSICQVRKSNLGWTVLKTDMREWDLIGDFGGSKMWRLDPRGLIFGPDDQQFVFDIR